MPTEQLNVPVWAWVVLGVSILASLAVDLLAHRGTRGRTRAAALAWTGAWIGLALAFGGWVAIQFGPDQAQDYFTAYLVEKSLSIDNLFVFLIVFSTLGIPAAEQHRVLLWGIIGAIVTRGAFIAGGAALLQAWHGLVYVLGAFLVFTGVKTARAPATTQNEEGRLLRFVRRHFRFSPELDGHRFFTRKDGRLMATPLFLALIVIETTDIVFAIDSIPAAFAISPEPFIVYSSNIFAVLGMRSLYLVVSDLLGQLKYLRFALAAILVLAGAKLLLSDIVHVPHAVTLLSVLAILGGATIPSLIARRRWRRASAR
jgi:tellurite resistance protein TerC